MRWYLGIEISGRQVQVAVGRGEGEACRAVWRAPVEDPHRAPRIQQQIIDGVDKVLGQARLDREKIAGVALGFAGPVETRKGLIVTSRQLGGWDGFLPARWIAEEFGWPAVLHNAADAAALAEARFGAGKGFDPVLYVSVGSGIGGGLVCGREIFRGKGASAMEIGQLRPGQTPRHVSVAGVSVEAIASGIGIVDRARRTIAAWEEATVHIESRFAPTGVPDAPAGGRRFPERFATLMKLASGERDQITIRLIAQAASQGDRLARELISDATDALGWALAQAITLINPGRIVIGGSVSQIGQELFFEPLREACKAEVFQPFAGIADIVPAALGEEAVVQGTLALARAAFYEEPELKPFAPDGEPGE